jgi:hypothetical protein
MDIRDFKEEVIYPRCGLTEIFKLQKVLIDHYVSIEGLPQYPIDINTRYSQKLIKDFEGRVIEELGEAWESYEIMMDLKDKGLPNASLIPHLQNFNEEVADAMHFWAELVIFCGLENNLLNRWLPPSSSDSLSNYLLAGEFTLDFELHKPLPSYKVIPDDELVDEFLRGGRKLGTSIKRVLKELLWDTVYHLQISRNTLKNKPWKQTEMMTDESLFESELMKATISMFQFFYFAGFSKESLYTIYFKKNLVNQFRIGSKY